MLCGHSYYIRGSREPFTPHHMVFLKVEGNFSDYSIQIVTCFYSSKSLPLLYCFFLICYLYISISEIMYLLMESFFCQNVSSTRARTLCCCASLNTSTRCTGRCTSGVILCTLQNAHVWMDQMTVCLEQLVLSRLDFLTYCRNVAI